MNGKRFSALKSALALLLTLTVLSGAASAAVFAQSVYAPLYRGSFRYPLISASQADEYTVPTLNSDEIVTDTFYFSDNYFSHSGKEIDEHLRTMSAALAFSAVTIDEEENPAQYVSDLLIDSGFYDGYIEAVEMEGNSEDSIGTVIVHKGLPDADLIAVAIRGYHYDLEWKSNFLAGNEGDAQGFAAAAQKVVDRIKAYLTEYGITSAKIWVSGYSRAGSVANLVGRTLNERPEDFSTTEDDIFVYTFDAPNCSADATVYENIHNVTDRNDLLTYVYPAQWGLSLNGVQEIIGDPSETVMAKNLDLTVSGYVADYKPVSKAKFIAEFEEFLSAYLNREQYVETAQQPVMELLDLYFSMEPSDRKQILAFIQQGLMDAKDDPNTVMTLFSILGDPESEESIDTVTELILDDFDKTKDAVALPLSGEEYQYVKNLVRPMVTICMPMVLPEFDYSDPENDKPVPFYHLLSAGLNLVSLVEDHFNGHLFAQIKAQDSYYTESAPVIPGDFYCNGWYTYQEYGESLFGKAADFGFTESDIERLKNGYDVQAAFEAYNISEYELTPERAAAVKELLGEDAELTAVFNIIISKNIFYKFYEGADVADLAANNPFTVTLPDDVTADSFVVLHSDGTPVESTFAENDGVPTLTFTAGYSDVFHIVAMNDREKSILRLGDVDGDEKVTIIDVTLIQRFKADLTTLDADQLKTGDVDGDGIVTIVDATHIQRHLADLSAAEGIGEPISENG